MAALQRASSASVCPNCGQVNCTCVAAVEGAGAAQPVDELELSDDALAAADQDSGVKPQPPTGSEEADVADSASKGHTEVTETSEGEGSEVDHGDPLAAEDSGQSDTELTDEEQAQLTELKSEDREVRAHEQAHIAAAGPYAQGGPSYEYEEGPDGNQYAVGGEVSIDTSSIPGDPEATIDKAKQVRAAALAPATPSSQDQRVAAAATQMAAQARVELAQQNQQYAAASYGNASETGARGTLLDLVA